MVAHEGDRIVDCGATDVRYLIDDVTAIHPLDLDYAHVVSSPLRRCLP